MRARVLLVLINLFSFGCLAWTLRDAKLGELRDDLATMDWKWVALAVIVNVGAYLMQAIRWSLVLRPVEAVGFWRPVRSVFIGLFANEVLPGHIGEVLRCYLLSTWTEVPFSVSLSSALIERVFDGIWLSLCLLLTLRFVEVARQVRFLVYGSWVLVVLVLGGAALLGVAMFRSNRDAGKPVVAPLASLKPAGWRGHLSVLLKDLGLIGHSRYLYFSLFFSLPYLLVQTIPVWASFKGYGFDLGLGEAFALMIFLRLSGVVPQAPGNLGVFQFLTKEILERVFNVVPDESARFSLVLWGIITLPLMIGGFIALWIEEADIIQLKRAAEQEAATLRSST
jgi:glycosyltransferase 2 family protein